ncbi:MAG TPA: hypothetical protein EYQ86_07965 [Bacteroidetes bacterium]|nr:hypothetical protein [Bacteroidota bacterium]
MLENYKDHKDFNALTVHILMNQRWFNGIGNYLRSEILYRVPDVNPWTPFNELTETQINNIINQCKECPTFAYALQGGKVLNSTKYVNEEHIENWRKIYSKKTSSFITDGNKRRFWFDSKWNSCVPQKYIKGKYLLKE